MNLEPRGDHMRPLSTTPPKGPHPPWPAMERPDLDAIHRAIARASGTPMEEGAAVILRDFEAVLIYARALEATLEPLLAPDQPGGCVHDWRPLRTTAGGLAWASTAMCERCSAWRVTGQIYRVGAGGDLAALLTDEVHGVMARATRNTP